MKCFIKGIVGAFVLLLAAAVIIPQYSDYRSRLETSEWILNIGATKLAVAGNANRLRSLTNSGIGVKVPGQMRSDPAITIMANGVILIRGKKFGQLLVIIPELSDNKVSWTCVGGSAKDVPPLCRAN